MPRFESGWVKLWRGAWNKDLSTNVYLWSIWHALLHLANWKESSVVWKGEKRIIPPGSVVFGMNEFASKFHCSERTISKWLKYLHRTERIILETCGRGSLVTLCNWQRFQSGEDAKFEQDADGVRSECAPDAIQVLVSEEGIKGISKSCGFDFEFIYSEYPKRRGDQGKKKAFRKLEREFSSAEKYDQLLSAVQNYKRECILQRKIGTTYVKRFETFLNGPWEEYRTSPLQQPLLDSPEESSEGSDRITAMIEEQIQRST